MTDRSFKERKLVALMVNDLEAAELGEQEMNRLTREVRALSEKNLNDTLITRLNLPQDTSEARLEEALNLVEEPQVTSSEEPGGFSRAPDMSHNPRPEERE